MTRCSFSPATWFGVIRKSALSLRSSMLASLFSVASPSLGRPAWRGVGRCQRRAVAGALVSVRKLRESLESVRGGGLNSLNLL
jgi:hypothetical protein